MNNDSLSKSATIETKEKFDNFLKAALKKSPDHIHQHKNIEINSNLKRNSNEDLLQPKSLEKNSDEENREFILKKYFENKEEIVEVQTARKPIPTPRTKITRSIHSEKLTASLPSSNETFNVVSPKIPPQKEIQNISFLPGKQQTDLISLSSSTNTFKVTVPKILRPIQIADNINDENNVIQKKIPVVGDVLLHDKVNASRLIDVEMKNVQNINDLEDDNSRKSCVTSKPDNDEEILDTDTKKERLKYNNENIITEDESQIEKYSFDKAIHLIIHRTDKLQLNSFLIHPVVKIHILDINTGKYFPKKYKERPVIYYYDSNLDYLAPVMTHPYNLREKRSLLPIWEETILINEDFEYLISEKHNIIIFFEILDFVSIPSNLKNKGWYPIAFAFLKICGKNNVLNLEKMLRLQLYCYTSNRNESGKCSVWEIWHNKKLTKYPSSLYITIKSVNFKEKISIGLRSKNALQKEAGNEQNLEDNKEKTAINTSKMNPTISALMCTLEKNQKWKRNTEDITKLPNKIVMEFPTEEGCFTLKFSHNGLFLACALKVNHVYSIVVYSVTSLKEICVLPGHKEIIYSISWSSDDSMIISASGDNSVSIWDIVKMTFLQFLPHPSFVYSVDIGVDIIATGCYDSIVRIWNNDIDTTKYVLDQELHGHDGYITCVIFARNYDIMFSSDSVGVIIEWRYNNNSWISQRKIQILDLTKIVINQIILMGKEKRLLVHSRDSILRILDLKTLIVVHWLHGGLNRRYNTSCSISPCNNYIIAGSENSSVNIWKTKNGKYVGNLIPYKNKTVTIHAVQFHPKDNMLCVGHFGNDLPLVLFGYDRTKEINEAENNITLIDGDLPPNKLSDKTNKQSNTLNNINLKNVLNKLDNLMDVKLK